MRSPDVARLLRERREQAGMTQDEVAAGAGISQSAVSAFERGTKRPSIPVLSALARAMNCWLKITMAKDRGQG